MNEFDPRGYLTLEKALEHFGQLKHADEWEAEKASSKREFQRSLFAADLSAEVLTDDGILHSLRSSIWGSVEAARIFETGRASISVGNEYFPDTAHGPVLIEQSSIDSLLDGESDDPSQSPEAISDGAPLAKGQEDAPAQSLPPHDEPDPQEPAKTPVPEGSEDEPAPPRKKPAELVHKRWVERAKELKELNPDIQTSAIALKLRREDLDLNKRNIESNDQDKIIVIRDAGTIRRVLTDRLKEWNVPPKS